ncbi:hypothetical protein J2Z40_001278 [Cytobacillus eiseniae]|uniref:GerMN domain-containing protein n=1 Tax=Cytobacillus eiseniae TaxID=762947 RepID=A0ABS4REI2_9BACI|nr:hypothetical protein [Cytobacillus eiseniae]
MKEPDWNDQQIKELLAQMPKIKDERDPNELYQNITMKMNKQKKKGWIMPTAAAAAAALLFFILAPTLLEGQFSEEKALDQMDTATSEISIMNEDSIDKQQKNITVLDENEKKTEESIDTENESDRGIRMFNESDSSTAVYEEDLGDLEVLTYAIPDPNIMLTVPVSILVSKEEGQTKFELFKKNMGSLMEEEWGLTDYFPLNAELSFDEESNLLTVDVPTDHTYGMGSASENIFNDALSYTMAELNIEKVQLLTNGKLGIDFGHYGFIESFVPDALTGNHAYYFYYPDPTASQPFIVPYGEKLDSIKEAFVAMKEHRKEANLQPSIPETLNFETKEDETNKNLTIHLIEGSTIMNDEATLHVIEAILLTAKDFDYQTVKIENANIESVGKFDLNQEIKVPIAANKRSLP